MYRLIIELLPGKTPKEKYELLDYMLAKQKCEDVIAKDLLNAHNKRQAARMGYIKLNNKLEQAYKDGVRDALAKGYGTFNEENYRD